MTDPKPLQVPPGHVAVTSYGAVTLETTQCISETRAHCERVGLTNLTWHFVHGALVDRARNEAVHNMLRTPAQWLLFLDADMVWAPNTIEQLLQTAYGELPWADIVGAWCPLRGSPFLPTIDTGTGTWEPQAPGQGPLEVIRTGAACVLIKRHVYERLEFPWYGIRAAARPLDMLAEVDNYARVKFDGRNPLWGDTWERLVDCARQDAAHQRHANPNAPPSWLVSTVGEDSNLCDKARAIGCRIVVQTNVVCHHVDRKTITPDDHGQAMREAAKLERLAVGILE